MVIVATRRYGTHRIKTIPKKTTTPITTGITAPTTQVKLKPTTAKVSTIRVGARSTPITRTVQKTQVKPIVTANPPKAWSFGIQNAYGEEERKKSNIIPKKSDPLKSYVPHNVSNQGTISPYIKPDRNDAYGDDTPNNGAIGAGYFDPAGSKTTAGGEFFDHSTQVYNNKVPQEKIRFDSQGNILYDDFGASKVGNMTYFKNKESLESAVTNKVPQDVYNIYTGTSTMRVGGSIDLGRQSNIQGTINKQNLTRYYNSKTKELSKLSREKRTPENVAKFNIIINDVNKKIAEFKLSEGYASSGFGNDAYMFEQDLNQRKNNYITSFNNSVTPKNVAFGFTDSNWIGLGYNSVPSLTEDRSLKSQNYADFTADQKANQHEIFTTSFKSKTKKPNALPLMGYEQFLSGYQTRPLK